jgi:histidinol phosphatase-like PHP family hydrolase
MIRYFTILIILVFVNNINAQEDSKSKSDNRLIEFPDVEGFKTLVCDFHQHSVFSDGNVWPSIRVQEAIKDGVDAISITEHLEYQPHKSDIPHPDRNRAFQIASEYAKNKDLLVISGSEITRSMPPGHSNAIFVTDSNKLLNDDAMTVFKEARNQNAFVFWNHPNWIPQFNDAIAKLTDMHRTLIKEQLLHGIEVVNESTYSEEALQIALDNDLAIMGTSDIHGLIDWEFEIHEGGHRPVTLVFAKEKTKESIKEALFDNRTAVYFNNLLIGREQHLLPLINASINITSAKYSGKSIVLEITIENNSDVDFLLKNQTQYSFHEHSDVITISANETTTLSIKTLKRLESLDLSFEVLNAIIAPKTNAELTFQIQIKSK